MEKYFKKFFEFFLCAHPIQVGNVPAWHCQAVSGTTYCDRSNYWHYQVLISAS